MNCNVVLQQRFCLSGMVSRRKLGHCRRRGGNTRVAGDNLAASARSIQLTAMLWLIVPRLHTCVCF